MEDRVKKWAKEVADKTEESILKRKLASGEKLLPDDKATLARLNNPHEKELPEIHAEKVTKLKARLEELEEDRKNANSTPNGYKGVLLWTNKRGKIHEEEFEEDNAENILFYVQIGEKTGFNLTHWLLNYDIPF